MTNLYYCWFGSSLPDHIKANIDTWQTYFKDVNIIRIDEKNFDYQAYPYANQAYEQGQYAFVSDVARLHFLNQTGGIYLDATVSVKQAFDDLLNGYDQVFGLEYYEYEICGILGGILLSKPNSIIFKKVLAYYQTHDFDNQVTINQHITNQLVLYGFKYKNKAQVLQVEDQRISIVTTKAFSNKTKSLYAYPNSLASWKKPLTGFKKVKRFIGKMFKKLIGRDRFNRLFHK